ncbi:MAG: alanine/glycine:cation symporter family protein [Verrucomicrobiota bacterium]|nr:alanine/glycine:cation symporter family protein [Verrucomicrobiota bacterium]
MSETLYELSGWLWGNLLYLLLGGGFFFAVFSRFSPFRYLGHGLALLLGKCDEPDAPGEVSHFRALCSALSGTVGMGNVAGVAVALTQGGPGALFWMWVCALLGMATKFYTCSLAVMYRGKDEDGVEQGGPMYFISEGLGSGWKPLAVFFATCGTFGCLPLLQSNQLTQIVRSMFFEPKGWFVGSGNAVLLGNGLFGLLLAFLVGLVVIGGIRRIGSVAARLVPGMILLYAAVSLLILTLYAERILPAFAVILSDAFTGRAMAGGALGMVIVTGVRRAAFSNEAGMGTEAMAHGAARTKEPIREGLVAMWGPVIDTLLMCTLTGLVLLVTDSWQSGQEDGVLLTTSAFETALPGTGPYLLLIAVLCLSFSSMIGFSYYVVKCGCFLFGQKARLPMLGFYLLTIVVSYLVRMGDVINFLDIAFGLMAIPTIWSTILLAPRVNEAARSYFAQLGKAH